MPIFIIPSARAYLLSFVLIAPPGYPPAYCKSTSKITYTHYFPKITKVCHDINKKKEDINVSVIRFLV